MFYDVLMEKQARRRGSKDKLDYDRDTLLRRRNATIGTALGSMVGGAGAVGMSMTKKYRNLGAMKGMALGVGGALGGGLLGHAAGKHLVGARGNRKELDAWVQRQVDREPQHGRNATLEDLRKNYGLNR